MSVNASYHAAEPEPGTGTEPEPYPHAEASPDSPRDFAFICAVCVWIVLIVLFNGWLTAAIVRARLYLKDVLLTYMASIAISSAVVAVLVLPVYIVGFLNMLSDALCKVCKLALHTSLGANLFCQMAAAYYQYLQVCRGESLAMRSHLGRIAVIWLLAGLFAFKALFVHGMDASGECADVVAPEVAQVAQALDLALFTGLAPLCIIALDLFTLCRVRREQRRMARMLVLLVVLYVMLVIPLSLMDAIHTFVDDAFAMSPELLRALTLVAFTFEWLSVMVFMAFDTAVREAMLALLACRKQQQRAASVQPTTNKDPLEPTVVKH